MLEPRRIAARAAAHRIAFERGVRVGDDVGYIVRFDQCVTPNTRLKIVTDGVLLRMLHDDPFLESASVVIFDEFHERGLNADLALAMLRRVQQTVRPELKLLVMSATLAINPIVQFLGNCPVFESSGRSHPVQIRYQAFEEARKTSERAATAVQQVMLETTGDVLVFLPGVAEIRRTAELLADMAALQNAALMQLYGDLPPDEQDAVLGPMDRRKIVLATNVAETSITIEGITAVVDTGLARSLCYDPAVGLDRLVLGRISRSSADQRSGRAGRTQPGLCLRLWTERDHLARPQHEEPEVRRVDLASAALQLMCWGESDPAQFPWFEQPETAALARAQALLERLGAINNGRVTELGHMIARLPVHPRIGRLLVEGRRRGVAAEAALVGALISERDPFLRHRTAPHQARPAPIVRRSTSDVLDRVLALEAFEQTGRVHSPTGDINKSAARYTLHVRDQLRNLGSTLQGSMKNQESRPLSKGRRHTTSRDEALLQSIFSAFPDRLARRRGKGSRGAITSGGRGVRLADSSAVLDADLFVCVDVAADRSESLVRLASAVERAWLPADRLTTRDEVRFDQTTERVVALRRTMWDDLQLDEVPCSLPSEAEVAAVLCDAAAQDLTRVLPAVDSDFTKLLARIQFLREWMPQLELRAFTDDELKRLLPEICIGRRSFADLRSAPWRDFVISKLTSHQIQNLERHAPERLAVPSGSRITLQYEVGRPPVLAVRIQELFGLIQTPRVAAGRVPVLLHLLAPSMRPQQVTDDLESFWSNTYPKIRSELRRRYPKHAWPEDPRTAQPQRGARRRDTT
jgi:ATP-dependent helicase HrpB